VYSCGSTNSEESNAVTESEGGVGPIGCQCFVRLCAVKAGPRPPRVMMDETGSLSTRSIWQLHRRHAISPVDSVRVGGARFYPVLDRGALLHLNRLRGVELHVAQFETASSLVPGNDTADMVRASPHRRVWSVSHWHQPQLQRAPVSVMPTLPVSPDGLLLGGRSGSRRRRRRGRKPQNRWAPDQKRYFSWTLWYGR